MCNVKKVTFTLSRAASFEYLGCWTLEWEECGPGQSPLQALRSCNIKYMLSKSPFFACGAPLLTARLWKNLLRRHSLVSAVLGGHSLVHALGAVNTAQGVHYQVIRHAQ